MFLETSRYFKLRTVQMKDSQGRAVTAIVLRRLPATPGEATEVQGNDQLDIMAQRTYQDPTRFWHIADANTELQAGSLVKPPDARKGDSRTRIILVPRQ